jgi:hypothetical protein
MNWMKWVRVVPTNPELQCSRKGTKGYCALCSKIGEEVLIVLEFMWQNGRNAPGKHKSYWKEKDHSSAVLNGIKSEKEGWMSFFNLDDPLLEE